MTMLSTSSRLRIQDILLRLANSEQVTLQERIFINKFADRDQSVASWLRKAKRQQQSNTSKDQIDNLIDDLSLGTADPDSSYNPDKEDLGDWFSGAPSWVSRS